MRLRGKLTESEFSEMVKMARSKMYWLRAIFRNWYPILLLCLILYGTISGLLRPGKTDWRSLGILWAIVGGLFAWVAYRSRSAKRRQLAKLNLTLPDWISLADDGVKSEGPDGSTSHVPWHGFKAWREGKGVVLIDRLQGKRFVVLPTGDLPEVEQQTLRGYLRSHVQMAGQSLQPE